MDENKANMRDPEAEARGDGSPWFNGRKYVLWIIVALAAAGLWFLAACAAPIVSACPPVPVYDQEFQTRLADELDALPLGSALGAAMVDYGRLRNQLRACRAG